MLSAAMEDYLKAIYHLREEGAAVVSTQELANRLQIAPPSATAMMKKLATLHLVSHAPYRGVELTPAGEKIALEVVRHHRLIETYLAEVLGIAWDKVHEEAERLEHVLSEEVEARMAEALGNPTHDPHGAPIPALDGTIHAPPHTILPLCNLVAGTRARVERVSDEDPELLRHLHDLGIVPGVALQVERAVPAEGVLHLRVETEETTAAGESAPIRILSALPARRVRVRLMD